MSAEKRPSRPASFLRMQTRRHWYGDQFFRKTGPHLDVSLAAQRVDNQSKLGPGENRKSVRIESAEPVEIGSLVLADIIRMPWGCASELVPWSTFGPRRPRAAELNISMRRLPNVLLTHLSTTCSLARVVELRRALLAPGWRNCACSVHLCATTTLTSVDWQDVIEGVNLDAENMISLHTDGPGCSTPSNPDASGSLVGSVRSPSSAFVCVVADPLHRSHCAEPNALSRAVMPGAHTAPGRTRTVSSSTPVASRAVFCPLGARHLC